MNIVIVEDSELVREQLTRLLSSEPRLRLVGVAAGEDEAVELLAQARPDAVLLDLALSPGSGLRVLERMRAAGNAARVLILSNNRDPALRAACLARGADGVFDKTDEAEGCLRRLLAWLPPLPPDEARRLQALHSARLLDSPEQEAFADIVRLATSVADAPIALLSLVDADRQWFLAGQGLAVRETSRSVAFCAHTILSHEMMEIPDARLDPRFADNPLVRGAPGAVFYAGMPLVLPSGEALGTLEVIDRRPRTLTPQQRQALKTLACAACSEIELRRRVLELEMEIIRRREAENHMAHLATRDPLTALPNRTALHDRLEQSVLAMARHGRQLAVLFVDLDRFKLINDTLGHAVGDHALIHAAKRLSGVLRASDTVARLGGDEFAVILPELDDGAQAMQVAGKIVDALGVPEEIRGHRLHLGCSVGVAVFPEHGASGEELVRHADLAMYQAKQAGGSRACLFSSELNTYAEEILALDGDLRDALGRGELFLHFQPQSAPRGARLRGVEALVRWRHPRFGVLAPDRFIPVAETRGLIVELGRQVLDMALAQLVDWDAGGLHVPRIAVNVSAAELSPGFAVTVETALARHGVAAERLELEITESALTSDGIGTLAVLTRLRAHGVGITVDDFGVGYSSLGQLRRLPIDCLKIDRSFVEEIDSCGEDAAIVTAIVTMAGALGLRTVAEGVERAAQIGVLETIGCESVQGYLLARPMAAGDFAAWARGFAVAVPPA